jgi:bacterioferritin (cytochrome b1)
MRSVVEGVLDAENAAISHYQRLITACDDEKDHVTQDLAITILANEEERRRQQVGAKGIGARRRVRSCGSG